MSDSQSDQLAVVLRILIVEDSPERQKVLQSLYREHAWILVHTAARAIRLVRAYNFDLISLDYDLAGPEDGDAVATAVRESRNAGTSVLVHSMNSRGAKRLAELLPQAVCIPLSKITARNACVRRLREVLRYGVPKVWEQVLRDGSKRDFA